MDPLRLTSRADKATVLRWLVYASVLAILVALTACGSSSAETDSQPEAPELAVEPENVENVDSADVSVASNPAQPQDIGSGGFSIGGPASAGSVSPAASSDTNNAIDSSEGEEAFTPEPFPSMLIEEENEHLEQALSMVPEDAFRVSFTHWNRLKRHNRVPEMTSDFPMDNRRIFLVNVLTKNQAAAAMDKEFIDVQANLWGWDSTDLVWEVEAQFSDIIGYLNILRLRPNLDLNKLADHLLEENFTPVEYEGFTIYSLPLTEKTEWHNISPLSIHNVVILHDEDTLILSPVIDSVQRVLDVLVEESDSFFDDPLVKRAAFQLIGMASVEMHKGEETCQFFSAGMSDKSRIINAATEQLSEWPVLPYQLMALGHAFSNEAQVDLVLFHYDDFRLAEADFEFRENLLRMGTSPVRNVPYSAQFILQDGQLDDALMTFSLLPSPSLSDRQGWPQTIIGWVQDQDALFAACVVDDFLGLDELQ